ncbi:MAG: prepilin-type N-terminal cleavage/methylation domain-containing protein [Candidatus Hydrogenedentota bacterium]
MLQHSQKGLSLTELLISILVTAIIFSALIFIYEIIYRNYEHGLRLIKLYEDVNNSNYLAHYIRAADPIETLDSGYIHLSYNNDTVYLYLYNENDTYPNPLYNQATYKLKVLEQDTFIYGEGKIISSNLRPPPLSYFSYADAKSDVNIRLTFNNNDDTIVIRKTLNVRNY